MFKDTVLQPGYPKDITQFGRGMPSQSIETALWWEDVAKTYFFKGDRWVRAEDEDLFFFILRAVRVEKFEGKIKAVYSRLYGARGLSLLL